MISNVERTGVNAEEVVAADAARRLALAPYQEVFDLWSKARTRRETTNSDYQKVMMSFALFVERKELDRISRRDVISFRDELITTGQSPTTASRKVGILKTMFRAAVDYELLSTNPADQVRTVKVAQQKPRLPFSVEDLNCLFKSPIFAENYRPIGGGKDACFWLPMLALFTGARVEELAQLLVTDIIHEPDLGYYLNISDEAEHSQLKNASSRRRIPIHAALLDCGFLDYAETVRIRRFLFPDLKPNPRNKLSGYFSNFFSVYLRQQVKIVDVRKVFHSFRHTFKDICRTVGIDEAVHDALTGHASVSVGRKYGNEQYPLAPLFAAMERYEVAGLDIDHLYTRPPSKRIAQSKTTMISSFYGLVIALCHINANHRVRPYIYVRGQLGEAAMNIEDSQIVFGTLPFPKLVLVQAWVEIHREELMANWENGRPSGDYFRIDPLR